MDSLVWQYGECYTFAEDGTSWVYYGCYWVRVD